MIDALEKPKTDKIDLISNPDISATHSLLFFRVLLCPVKANVSVTSEISIREGKIVVY